YPAATSYLSELGLTASSMTNLGLTFDNSVAAAIVTETNEMMAAVAKLSEANATHDFADTQAHMRFCADVIRDLMNKVRLHADALEGLVADELWPLPKYQEMLFIK
ncbi:MAG: glutamine synthetase type III, partial [Psychromonas sp.]